MRMGLLVSLALSVTTLAWAHDERGVPFLDRCKNALNELKENCQTKEDSKDNPGRLRFSNCTNGFITEFWKSKSTKEDGGPLGARLECHKREVRTDGSIDLTTYNNLGAKITSFKTPDGFVEWHFYPKDGGMLECHLPKGAQLYTWCGINDPGMKNVGYDFLIKRPTDEEKTKLMSGSTMQEIFPASRRAYSPEPPWHASAKKKSQNSEELVTPTGNTSAQ